MFRLTTATVIGLAALTLAACGGADREEDRGRTVTEQRPAAAEPAGHAAVDRNRLVAAAEDNGQWLSYGRTYDEQRFSPLAAINDGNVQRLGLAWFADFDTNRTQQATPIVVDGVIYASTAWSKVNAYDARSGELLWHFDPQVPGEWAINLCCDVVNRGVAVWDGKVYIGTLDGRLIALDAATGEPLWDVMTIDPNHRYSITGAPRVVNGLVLIGNGGAEFLVRGYVTAYDADTGEKAWRFWTVPGNPADGPDGEPSDAPLAELALDTWTGEWWEVGGGGTVWDSIVYDPETDLLYIGVGNGSPWPRSQRSPDGGDNLFLSSIVALRPDTGEYVWHYQTTPGDSWDYTATQPMIVADLDFGGQSRRVVMQAPKNGFFYVLHAYTGELISAEAFAPLNWAEGVDPETGRPIEVPGARYDETGEGFMLVPGPLGANSWNPMSYNPDTGLVYIPARHNDFPMVASEGSAPMGQNLGISFTEGFRMYAEAGAERIDTGFLLAWDPVRQREAWRVQHPEDGGAGGGTLTTAGNLVFQGTYWLNTAGTGGGEELVAYSADTGERLWAMPTQTGVVAPPVTWEMDGEQHVAVVVGRSASDYYLPNHSRLLVLKLDGTAELPPAPEPPTRRLNPPQTTASAGTLEHGSQLFDRYCALCHGGEGQRRGLFPDLRYSTTMHSQETFDSIVLDGVLSGNGMVGFSDYLDGEDSAALRAYVIDTAQRAQAASQQQ